MLEFKCIVKRGLFEKGIGQKRPLQTLNMKRVHDNHLLNVYRETNWLIYMYTALYSMSTNLAVCTSMQLIVLNKIGIDWQIYVVLTEII